MEDVKFLNVIQYNTAESSLYSKKIVKYYAETMSVKVLKTLK